jgi:GT2 family glycosyltransferase
MKSKGVAIGYVHGELVHARFMTGVIDEMQRDGALVIEEFSEPYIDKARNVVVDKFLASDRDWLLTVDTDVILPACVVTRLMSRGLPLVGALIYVNQQPPFPQIYDQIADFSYGDMGIFQVRQKWEPGELLKADGTGAGCMLIHREVFEAIHGNPPFRWYQHEFIGNEMFGEDFTFCRRAKAAGFQLYIDTSVHAGHIKPHII